MMCHGVSLSIVTDWCHIGGRAGDPCVNIPLAETSMKISYKILYHLPRISCCGVGCGIFRGLGSEDFGLPLVRNDFLYEFELNSIGSICRFVPVRSRW